MPPKLHAEEGIEFLTLPSDVISEAKRKLDQPLIIVVGDFNQFDPSPYLSDHPEVKEVRAGPTRGERHIDRIYTGFQWKIKEKGVVAPLQANVGVSGVDSDHRVFFIKAELEKRPQSSWEEYYTRKYSDQKAEWFGEWLVMENWSDLIEA